MKAIATRYSGCYFRSRLEARWAVFFNRLGVNWQYEPEGFDLGGAGHFLPDFRVINLNNLPLWVEVKPLGGAHPSTLDYRELLKLQTFARLAHMHDSEDIIVVGEFSDPETTQLTCWRYRSSDRGRDFWGLSLEHFGADRQALRQAWTAARSARFEFGYSGTS